MIVANSGNMNLNGTLKAREVTIETTTWSDFVFAKDYSLPTLNEVKLHIDANKHLPGIPSEAEETEETTAYTEILSELTIRIYPNPTDGWVRVEIENLPPEETASIALYQLSGKMILNKRNISYSTELNITDQLQENWTLPPNQDGNQTYIARESIRLKTGFSYKAASGNNFVGKIDPTLVFPPADNVYAKPDGTITTDPAQGAVVGTIVGQSMVTPSGAAAYTVPIECPSGINGQQPQISLVYNSQGGNGIAGWGFNIAGLSAITRAPQTIYSDGTTSGIKNTSVDKYALDGNRLVVVSGVYGGQDSEYRTVFEIIDDASEQYIYKDFPINLPNNPEQIFVADFDGDGLQDIMVVTKSGYSLFWNQGGALSSCFSNNYKTTTDLFNSDYSRIRMGDFNGDGLPDFLVNEHCNANWHILINKGNRSFSKTQSSIISNLSIIEESYTTVK
jgi:hypothetical protein